MSMADNLAAVRTRIDDACRACDRNPGEVSLLPVSKTKPPSMVDEAYRAGYRLFGENKVQDALAKSELMDANHPGLEWSIIGGLQTNKAKYVARFATEFQALDSLKIAHELDKRLQKEGRQLRVLVQVNSSAEPQKSGIAPEEAVDFARERWPSIVLTSGPWPTVLTSLSQLKRSCARRRAILATGPNCPWECQGIWRSPLLMVPPRYVSALTSSALAIRHGHGVRKFSRLSLSISPYRTTAGEGTWYREDDRGNDTAGQWNSLYSLGFDGIAQPY